jgi:hypothetical protein
MKVVTMSRFLRQVIVLWSLLAAFACAAVLLGNRQPTSALLQNLHLGECAAPCWIGIRPGETPIREAYDLLTNSFSMRPFRPPPYTLPTQFITLMLPIDHADRQLMPIQFGILDHTTDEIRIPAGLPGLTKPQVMPKLGDVFLLLGEPNCLRPWTNSFNGWSLIYTRNEGVIEISFDGDSFMDWQQPVSLLSLRAAETSKWTAGCAAGYGLIPWAKSLDANPVSVAG